MESKKELATSSLLQESTSIDEPGSSQTFNQGHRQECKQEQAQKQEASLVDFLTGKNCISHHVTMMVDRNTSEVVYDLMYWFNTEKELLAGEHQIVDHFVVRKIEKPSYGFSASEVIDTYAVSNHPHIIHIYLDGTTYFDYYRSKLPAELYERYFDDDNTVLESSELYDWFRQSVTSISYYTDGKDLGIVHMDFGRSPRVSKPIQAYMLLKYGASTNRLNNGCCSISITKKDQAERFLQKMKRIAKRGDWYMQYAEIIVGSGL